VDSKIGRWLFAVYVVALLAYSQTLAATGDEGYHLLAAQLIRRGMRPFVDFFFPQAPLNAWWNAGWMSLFGDTWRVSHATNALLTAGAVLLAARFFYSRFPDTRWRMPGAVAVGLMAGLNVMVVEYGPLAQAYGTGILLTMAAFRLTVAAAEQDSLLAPAAAGLCAGAGAGCTLLTAAAGPVMALWLLLQSGTKRRWAKVSCMAAAALIPWLPVAWLAVQGPRQAWFNLVQYHARWRTLYWPDTTRHDLETVTLWIDSGQALTLGLLALAGLAFIYFRSGWTQELKAKFYLCGWLALGISLELCRAHPTFQRYFLLIVPYLALLAGAGLYEIGSRLFAPGRPALPLAIVSAIMVLGLAKSIYERRELYTFRDYERVARRVDQVTPRGAPLFADEMVYFLTRRPPPSGLENVYSHKVALSPADEALMHLIPQSEMDRRLSSGTYATVYTCEDDETYNKLHLPDLYRHKEESDDCMIFWDKK